MKMKSTSTFLRKATLSHGHPSPGESRLEQLHLTGKFKSIISYWEAVMTVTEGDLNLSKQLSFLDNRKVNRAQVGP